MKAAEIEAVERAATAYKSMEEHGRSWADLCEQDVYREHGAPSFAPIYLTSLVVPEILRGTEDPGSLANAFATGAREWARENNLALPPGTPIIHSERPENVGMKALYGLLAAALEVARERGARS